MVKVPAFAPRRTIICVASLRPQSGSAHKHQRHAAYATETSGLLLIALLLLIFTVARYWHAIHWSLR